MAQPDPRRQPRPSAGRSRRPAVFALLLALACAWPGTAAIAQVRVEISGVGSTVEDNIRASLDLVRHGAREDLSEAAIRRLYARGRGQVRDAMRPFGFYRPRIEPQLTREEDGEWVARFEIEPGDPVLVVEVDVRLLGEGSDDAGLLGVIAQSPIRQNRRLRHPEYDRLRNNLESTAAMLGYLEARFEERRLEVDPSENTARIVLHLRTGPRYRFGEVNVEQDILNEDLLQKIVTARAGEPYDATELLQTQYRLTDSMYFASVIVETGIPDAENRTVPINVETTPTRRQRIRTGIGFATDTGPRGTLGVDWRRLNRAGHSAGTELRLSETLGELSARYRIPIGDPLNERLLFRADLTQEDLGDLESRRARIGASHVTLRGGGWQRTLFTDLLDERTAIPGEPSLRDTLLVPGIGMEKLITDDILFPRDGYRLRGEVRGSQELLGARNDFLRMEFEANRVYSIEDRWRFFLRSRVGVGIVEGFATLPASQRFFAGGDQSVRGYGYNALGPQDEDGNVIGGRHLLFGSIEAERRVWGRVAAAAFVDAGNALDTFSDDIEVAVGLGVNVHTPIGTLRIAVAQSVTEDRSPRLHLSLRPDL